MRLSWRVRKWLLIVAGLILAGWLAPPFFHAGRYRRILQTGLERTLGRRVELGAVTFRLLPHPGFSIDNVVVEEDPKFGSEPFARVGRMECDLRWRSLWRSRIDCARIFLDHPSLNLVRDAGGKWNIQDFIERRSSGRAQLTGKTSSPGSTFDFEAQGARINFTLGGVKKPLVLNASVVWLQFNPSQGTISFHLAASPVRIDLPLPAPGSVDITGRWRPGRDFTGPFQIAASTRGSLLYGWIPLLTGRNPEIYGLLGATVRIAGSIQKFHLDGHARVDQLHRWESLPPAAPMPVQLTFAASWSRPERRVLIRSLDASFADSHLHVAGEISPLPGSPRLDLVLAIQRSRAENLLAISARLTGHSPPLAAAGRVDGLLTLRGPLTTPRYGGFVTLHSARIAYRHAVFAAPEAGIRIGARGVFLLPARFDAAPGVQCTAEGFISAPPSATPSEALRRRAPAHPESPRYELTLSTKASTLHNLMQLARELGAANLRRLDSRGMASAAIVLAGDAWPFSKPQLTASVSLHNDELLVPGLTEPLELRRVQLEVKNRSLLGDPVVIKMGPSVFSGWLEHSGARDAPWSFHFSTPHLSLEEASLWFAVLGHRRPVPILDLIPGLRSLAARRSAGRALFASVNAVGDFESPRVTFRSMTLHHFRAALAVASRRARVLNASFQAAGGQGRGEADVDFGRQPAALAGNFTLAGLKLHQLSGWLPSPLHGIRGSAAATGRFTTRGLTLQEMSAHLKGKADVRLKRILFGVFDPLESAARAASLGSLMPARAPAEMRSARLLLSVANKRVTVTGTDWTLSGAKFDLAGNYGFNGIADFTLHANLSHISRRWVQASVTVPDPAATLRFTGHLKSLALTPVLEAAQVRR